MNLTSTHQHGHEQLCKTQTSDVVLSNEIHVIPSFVRNWSKSRIYIYEIGKKAFPSRPVQTKTGPQVIMEGDSSPTQFIKIIKYSKNTIVLLKLANIQALAIVTWENLCITFFLVLINTRLEMYPVPWQTLKRVVVKNIYNSNE